MKRCRFDCEIINKFDLFGKEPEFFYKGSSQKTSYFGRILSVIYVVLYICFFVYKLARMVKKVDIDFYETYAFTGIPSVSLNSENFYAGFSIGGMIDKQIYYPVMQYWVETRTNGIKNPPEVKDIELEVCQLSKFGKRHQDLLRDKPLENFYCIKNVKEDLIGYGSLDTFSYYYIMLFPCVGTHPDGTPCKPIDEVTAFFQKTFLEFSVQDIELTPKDYDNPSEPLTKDITTPVFQGLYQSIFGYFQIVNMETNLDIVGFEAISAEKHEKFLKYDESWIIASPSPHQGGLNPNYPVCDVMIQLSAKVVTIKRTNTKLIDVLGDVGGVMEVLWSLFNIISMFITDLLYDIDIVNNLFSFDLDKKQVLIKKLKKDNNVNNTNNILYENKETKEKLNDSCNTYHPKMKSNKMVRINIVNLNENDLNPTIENESEIELRNKRKKITKKMNTSTLRKNLQIKDEINNNKNIETQNLNKNEKTSQRNINKKVTINDKMISIDDEIKQRNIMDNVYINPFFTIFAFCCIRKINNVNCYVLEEGLDIIKERLDVINIFKKLYYSEKIQELFKDKKKDIDMTDKCKAKLK